MTEYHKDITPESIVVQSYSSSRLGAYSMSIPKGVRVVHIPTGINVYREKGSSQHSNRHLALLELTDKLNKLGGCNE